MKKLLSLLLILGFLLSGCSEPQGTTEFTAAATVSGGEELFVHYIDVGQADSILIEYGDWHMLIDGGNREDGSLVVSYLEQQGIEELDAVICTHAHEDHVGGLPAVLAVYPVGAIYSPTKTYSSKIFDDFMHYADLQGREVIIPEPGSRIDVGELSVTFLGPVKSYADPNDTSIVCRVEYEDTAFLFTGDMETAAENDMLDYWGEDMNWEVDVLKVGHHGSNTSTGYRFLNAVNPAYGVIPVGTDNDYGHPHEEPMSRLNQAGVTLFRTDKMGTILARSDGNQVTFTWENQSAQPDNAESATELYIGNKNSKKFHAPSCSNLPSLSNQVAFSSYDEAVSRGYTPCGNCMG